ncbi:MAG TPA: hypothetical protein VHB78_06510 [Vicinamibacterales bacterium]|nr:hypothetical protein [Vicinamibacterales bacterium]
MGWVIALLVLIAAFVVPGFGRALMVLAGVLVVVLFAVNAQDEQERAASRTRIGPQEVELSDMRLEQSPYGSSNRSYQLTGRIKNLSKAFNINSVQLRIVLNDCVVASDCSTVGDKTEVIDVSVPPGQTRGIDQTISFSAVPPFRGAVVWNYSIAEIRAQ